MLVFKQILPSDVNQMAFFKGVLWATIGSSWWFHAAGYAKSRCYSKSQPPSAPKRKGTLDLEKLNCDVRSDSIFCFSQGSLPICFIMLQGCSAFVFCFYCKIQVPPAHWIRDALVRNGFRIHFKVESTSCMLGCLRRLQVFLQNTFAVNCCCYILLGQCSVLSRYSPFCLILVLRILTFGVVSRWAECIPLILAFGLATWLALSLGHMWIRPIHSTYYPTGWSRVGWG